MGIVGTMLFVVVFQLTAVRQDGYWKGERITEGIIKTDFWASSLEKAWDQAEKMRDGLLAEYAESGEYVNPDMTFDVRFADAEEYMWRVSR